MLHYVHTIEALPLLHCYFTPGAHCIELQDKISTVFEKTTILIIKKGPQYKLSQMRMMLAKTYRNHRP